MDENEEFLRLDAKLREITTGGSVSYEDQDMIIASVVADSVENYADSLEDTDGIMPESHIGIALHDMQKTAYFSEAQF